MGSNEINYSWSIVDEENVSTFDKYIKDFVDACKEEEIINSVYTVSNLIKKEEEK